MPVTEAPACVSTAFIVWLNGTPACTPVSVPTKVPENGGFGGVGGPDEVGCDVGNDAGGLGSTRVGAPMGAGGAVTNVGGGTKLELLYPSVEP